MTDGELEDAAPNCPQCLHPLEASGTEEHPYWQCPACGYAAIGL